MVFRAPLLGYNTNVRHKGRLYHIQTEDSGIGHPHIITHLFADGGRIVASKKTSYAEQVGADGLPELVKKLMQAQHKAMFIALRDCVYDDQSDLTAEVAGEVSDEPAENDQGKDVSPAADQASSEKPALYQSTVGAAPEDAAAKRTTRKSKRTPAVTEDAVVGRGEDKGLDEVILMYLASEEPE